MDTVTTVSELRSRLRPLRREGRRIGLVPTMGYLHAGHLALVQRARQECDFVVATIFVNPLQFGPAEDLDHYPRDLERDTALLTGGGCDLLFAPTLAEMYPQQQVTFVEPTLLTEHLCGASRPGHFRGVATVVSKLLHLAQPERAYFGEKDAQQLAVIRRMVADLNMDVTIVGVPIVREPDGLALSSRNAYLSPDERQAAVVLSRALAVARDLVAAGERDAGAVTGAIRDLIAREPLARVDYVAAVDADTLHPLTLLSDRVLVALAVYMGNTRLIDNTSLVIV